ncbi:MULTISPECIES: hypothetical protein [Sporosarcina]|uniref:hypothetical protein n=1 Tax=Sporosarcina TaxID=1569 RepID=UPI000ADD2553|nr:MULTISPECIES: hypothetical protein [Sporosarcina]WJY28118.1 hypothetical protein QWT68_03815 [Sporosarcina sp. 0.2-SM1T-5]
MDYFVSRKVRCLLIPYSEEKSVIVYGPGFLQVEVPQIGIRPPYYAHPVYDSYLPVL